MKANGSDARKIWTPLVSGSGGTTNYVGYWNNWNEDNYVQINDLFEMTGNIVRTFIIAILHAQELGMLLMVMLMISKD